MIAFLPALTLWISARVAWPWLTVVAWPVLLPVAVPLVNSPQVGMGGQPIGGPAAAFLAGGAPIEPRLLYFAAGRPIGGPVAEAFRGVRAATFPFFLSALGPGAPLGPGLTGLAGAPIGWLPGVGGAPIG